MDNLTKIMSIMPLIKQIIDKRLNTRYNIYSGKLLPAKFLRKEDLFMKDITIKEIYAGKPDAKDEINFSESDEFIKTFVVAEHFNIESLITGTNCFITGFKGTGKTALLYYLDNLLKEQASAYRLL